MSSSANNSIFAAPDYHLLKIEFETRRGRIIPMSRASYRESPFLDDRVIRISTDEYLVDIDQILAQYVTADRPAKPPHYIFHTAFCCSTLMSRALDMPGKTMGYREPVPLHQIATLKRRIKHPTGKQLEFWDRLLDLEAGLLSRTYAATETPIVKPTDSCNNLIRPLIEMHDASRAVLLYSELKEFLVSALKTPGRRQFVRTLANRAELDAQPFPMLAPIKKEPLDDGQCAAYVWLAQIHLYLDALNNLPGRCRTITAAEFLTDTAQTLEAISTAFQLDLDTREIDEIVSGPVFRKHAKDPRKAGFTEQSRLQEMDEVSSKLHDEIRAAEEWAQDYLSDDAMQKLHAHALI